MKPLLSSTFLMVLVVKYVVPMMNSYDVTIQMKPLQQYFHVVLFV